MYDNRPPSKNLKISVLIFEERIKANTGFIMNGIKAIVVISPTKHKVAKRHEEEFIWSKRTSGQKSNPVLTKRPWGSGKREGA